MKLRGCSTLGQVGFFISLVNVADASVGLAPLGWDGGPTQTFALLPGSPALNAQNPVTTGATDQRGQSQVGRRDIGACESQGFTYVTSPSGGSATLGQTFAPLTLTVTPLDTALASIYSSLSSQGRVTLVVPTGTGNATATGTLSQSIAGGPAIFNLTAAEAKGNYTAPTTSSVLSLSPPSERAATT